MNPYALHLQGGSRQTHRASRAGARGKHRRSAATARYDIVKRVIDIVVSSVLLIITAPLQLVVAVMVAVKLGRPVIFRQRRPGRGEKAFTLRKFRTMLDVNEAAGLVTDADRLTPFGAWLRSTSFDELPTLFNVLRGDMSLVGPRPLLMHYLQRYTPEQARRHDVRPGITGLAQVNGRNEISWADKLANDVRYVDSRCLRLDLRILVRTVVCVLRREGISGHGEVTTAEFTGQGGPAL